MLVTLILLLSMIVLFPLPTPVKATPTVGSVNLSKTGGSNNPLWNLTCGEIVKLEVTDNSLNASETYYLKVWNGTHWIKLADGKSDSYGDLTIEFHVPGWGQLHHNPVLENGSFSSYTQPTNGRWNITLWDKHGTQVDGFNETLIISYLYMAKYKYNGNWVDYILYNKSYSPFYIYVYNWTSSGWQVESTHHFNLTLYEPDKTTEVGHTDSPINSGYWDYGFGHSTTAWKDVHSDPDNLENYFWVKISNTDSSSVAGLVYAIKGAEDARNT